MQENHRVQDFKSLRRELKWKRETVLLIVKRMQQSAIS